jgi:hypothetical protein
MPAVSKLNHELDEKAREKIFYNIWKASITNDRELFKNFRMKCGSLEPSSVKRIIGYLLFGIKQPRKIQ